MPELFKETPWDAPVFGFPTAELIGYDATLTVPIPAMKGHCTAKVSPLADKRRLHASGFYYCDTLIEPFCTTNRLLCVERTEAKISKQMDWDELLSICNGAFEYGRFHRDFNLNRSVADARYDRWLQQLYEQGNVYGLYWGDQAAGFIAHEKGKLLLHAVATEYRSKGLAKYWWSKVSQELFDAGNAEVSSSISAANLAVLNLYATLGFSFRNPLDVYHRFSN